MAEIPAELRDQYAYASKGAAHWDKQKKDLAARIKAIVGDDETVTVNGQPAYTFEYIDKLNTTEFKKGEPGLVERFTVMKADYVFDVAALKANEPDIYRRYQVRQLRAAG